MFLRDPMTSIEHKCELLDLKTQEGLSARLGELYREKAEQPIRSDLYARTYRSIFEQRLQEVNDAAAIEKKERNSTISLTCYSSQGNIIAQPGITQLGESNDQTSFTTELRPNVVTPISSFFTKSGSGAKSSSPFTGI